MPRAAIYILLCFFATVLCACGATTRELEQTSPQEARYETTVKAALIAEKSVDAASIQVIFSNGSITLSGFVGSESESTTAAKLARENAEGLRVINTLEIR